MNSAVVMIILLLAVPLQLFLTHYINTTYASSLNTDSTDSGSPSVRLKGNNVDRLQSLRTEALLRWALKRVARGEL